MKTSHAIIGTAGTALLLYLMYKNQKKTETTILPDEPTAAPGETFVASTVPVIMQKPQAETFIPIIKEPGQPKPEPITTVSPEPVSKPVYVAPVDNPVPVYTKPYIGFKKVLVDDALSGFNMF